jgi:hypothetical protein
MMSDIRTLADNVRNQALDLQALLPHGQNRPATVTLDTETLWRISTTIADAAGDIEDLVDEIQDTIGR